MPTNLVLCEDDHLYVVDGQHRVESLIALFEENPDVWGSYAIPFVCLLGADLNGEMTEFHVVNSNAKSIGTGLAMEWLKRRAEASEIVRDQLVETGRVWIDTASKLTDALKKTELWTGKIQFTGQPKTGTLTTNNGMVTSLWPLVEQPGYFQSVGDPVQQSRILDAYWKGIKTVLPETMAEPERFNLQRTLGTTALHGVLVNVLAVMVSQGHSVLEPERYADIMRNPLIELGETNAEGAFVQGADFWRRGSEGASGLFNGRPGTRVLQSKIKEHLPNSTDGAGDADVAMFGQGHTGSPELQLLGGRAIPGTPSWSRRLVRIYPKTEVMPGVHVYATQ